MSYNQTYRYDQFICIAMFDYVHCTVFRVNPLAQNLREGIVMKTSCKTRVSRMGLGSFVNINIFVMKYYFIVSSYPQFFANLLSQNLQNVKTPKRYSFKFWALQSKLKLYTFYLFLIVIFLISNSYFS